MMSTLGGFGNTIYGYQLNYYKYYMAYNVGIKHGREAKLLQLATQIIWLTGLLKKKQ